MPPLIGYDVLGNPIYASPPGGKINPYAYQGAYAGPPAYNPYQQQQQSQPNPFEWFLLGNILATDKKKSTLPLSLTLPFPGLGGLGFGIPLW